MPDSFWGAVVVVFELKKKIVPKDLALKYKKKGWV